MHRLLILVILVMCGCAGVHKKRLPINVVNVDTGQTDQALVRYGAEGGAAFAFSPRTKRHICSLPPAQGMRLLEQALMAETKADVAESVSAETKLSSSSVETIGKLYEQSDRTLFLQFALYNLCQAHANGEYVGRCDYIAQEHALAVARLNDANAHYAANSTDANARAVVQSWQQQTKALRAEHETCLKTCDSLIPSSTTRDAATQAQANLEVEQDKLKTCDNKLSKLSEKVPDCTGKKGNELKQCKAKETAAKQAVVNQQSSCNQIRQNVARLLTIAKKYWSNVEQGTEDYERCANTLTGGYDKRFSHIIQAVVDLHEIDRDKAKYEAEKAKSDALKAKADAAKAKPSEDAKKLNELKASALEKAIQSAFPKPKECDPKTDANKCKGGGQ